MEISQRLRMVADLVHYSTMADIGTDHGYVPIYLHKLGKIKKAIACDINAGPLEKAKEHIKAYGAEEIIETRRGNGLMPIAPGEVESVVIAGMGGMLTIEILQDSLETVQSVKELILAPQLDLRGVRKFLHSIGFFIMEEHMLKEEGKFYTLLRAAHGQERYEKEAEYLYGKQLLEKKDPVLKEYILVEKRRLEAIKKRLCQADSENARERLQAVRKEQERLEEVEKWL